MYFNEKGEHIIKPEMTNNRDLRLNILHKTPSFGFGAYAIDIDFVEYDFVKDVQVIRAIWEAKDILYTSDEALKKWRKNQMGVYLSIAKALNIPAFLVRHNCTNDNKNFDTKSRFVVENLFTNEEIGDWELPEFIKFIVSLHK